MSAIRLRGATSGTTDVVAAAIAGDGVMTLPSGTGTLMKVEGGKVLQVVSTFKNDTFSSSSTSFVDITGFTVSITPSSATSKVLVLVAFYSSATGANSPRYNLVRGATTIAQPSGGTSPSTVQLNTASSTASESASIIFLDSPATTSATTYKMQGRTDGNSFLINRRGDDANETSVSSITVMEISA